MSWPGEGARGPCSALPWGPERKREKEKEREREKERARSDEKLCRSGEEKKGESREMEARGTAEEEEGRGWGGGRPCVTPWAE